MSPGLGMPEISPPPFFFETFARFVTMKTRLLIVLAVLSSLFCACSKKQAEQEAAAAPSPEEIIAQAPETHGNKVDEVKLTNPLKEEWVTGGKAIYEMKCLACHKLTGDKVVGPGWAGVTKKRKPEWIMNMILNVDMMLETDTEAQALLEQCLVRMPNQNLSNEEARSVLEFMRSNDGEK